MVKLFTGYDCPFCGVQRAFTSILHGDFIAAFKYNPYLFFISPYLLIVILCMIDVFPKESKIQKIAYSTPVIIIAGSITMSWWIIRNTSLLDKFFIFVGI